MTDEVEVAELSTLAAFIAIGLPGPRSSARDKSLLYSLFPSRIDCSAKDEPNLARMLFLIIGANSVQYIPTYFIASPSSFIVFSWFDPAVRRIPPDVHGGTDSAPCWGTPVRS